MHQLTPNGVCVAETFRDVLHQAVKDGLVEGVDEIQTARAIQTHHGWMHVNGELVLFLFVFLSLADLFSRLE